MSALQLENRAAPSAKSLKKAKKAKAAKKAKKVAARKAAKKLAATAAAKKSKTKPAPAPTPTPTPTPTVPTLPAPDGALPVTSFGAVGDGVTDNCVTIQRALDTVGAGKVLSFPAGQVFAHSCVLKVTTPGLRLTGGGTLHATNEQRSSLHIAAANVTVDNLKFTVGTLTQRWEAYEQMRVRVGAVDSVTLADLTIDGSAAAGIYVGGASNFTIARVEVKNTKADAIHITESAHDGLVADATIRNAGDDGVAVVTYGATTTPARNITVLRPKLYGQSWGRAYSVVGGDSITFRDIYAEGSSGASVYIAAEAGGYNTAASTNIVVDGGVIKRANQTASIDHGAVLLYNGRSAVNSNITVQNLVISDTRSTASRQIGIIQDSGGTHERVLLKNILMTGGGYAFVSTAPLSSYNRVNVVHNGEALVDRFGWS